MYEYICTPYVCQETIKKRKGSKMGSDNMGPSSHPPERISNVVKSYDSLFVSELSGSLHPSSCLFLV